MSTFFCKLKIMGNRINKEKKESRAFDMNCEWFQKRWWVLSFGEKSFFLSQEFSFKSVSRAVELSTFLAHLLTLIHFHALSSDFKHKIQILQTQFKIKRRKMF